MIESFHWTQERIDLAIACLRESRTTPEAVARFNARSGAAPVTLASLRSALANRGIGTAGLHLGGGLAQKIATVKSGRGAPAQSEAASLSNGRAPEAGMHETAPSGEVRVAEENHGIRPGAQPSVEDLVALAKKHAKRGGLTVQVAADELDLSPRRTVELFQRAQRDGYAVDFVHGEIAWKPSEPSRRVVDIPAAHPVEPGKEVVVGGITDLHFASKHHENAALREHVERCYRAGARHIVVGGDLVAGGGRYLNFLKYEITCVGIEAQCAELLDGLPQHSGLRYELIGGNHDESFDVGISAARMAVKLGEERGRRDLFWHGDRGARLRLAGLRWELWHPGDRGQAYALSYRAQRHVDGTALEDRPDVLFIGHWHRAAHFLWGGVHCILGGCFESGDSSFGRSIGGDVALGGWIFRYTPKHGGGYSRFAPEWCSYPQRKMTWREVAP